MYKKIILLIIALSLSLYAKDAPKMGCVLSQTGAVVFEWAVYGDKKYAIEGKDAKVKYTAIQKEGHIFKEILVGSTLETSFESKKLKAKITHIQSKTRIARGPRHGVVVMNINLNGVSKDIPMVYFYESGDMSMKANILMSDFNLSSKKHYAELHFKLQVYSVVCAIN